MSQIGEAPLTAEQKTDLRHRLSRVEGQLRKLQKVVMMAIEPADCDDALQQLAAARKALDHCHTQLACATMVTQAANARDLGEVQDTTRQLAHLFGKYLS